MRIAVAAITVLAACASGSRVATAPITATVAAPPAEATRRLVDLLTRDGIAIQRSDALVVTTAAIDRLELTAGAGAARATATVEYFLRATVTGDSVSTVTLTPWARVVSRDVAEREQPVPPTCGNTDKCAALHARLRGYAAALAK